VITILIVDDHPVVRDGLSTLIDTVDGMTVVAQVGNAADAVAETVTYRPDVVLMDLNMPNGSGIEATRLIASRCPASKVLVLTMSDDLESINAAMRAGARGYLLKEASQKEILRAIDTIAGGGALFSPAIADAVLSQLNDSHATGHLSFPDLTPRERDVLTLLARGERNHAIATTLSISTKTVANHLSNIFAKLQVEDRAHAIIAARAAGLGDG
jgi:DNA-binding NarL/FixJ family response regulator